MKRWIVAALVAGFALSGCKKEKPPEPEKKAEVSKPKEKKKPKAPKIKLPSLAPDDPTTAVEGAATSADYEEEANRTVRFENLEAELDRLEAEITGG